VALELCAGHECLRWTRHSDFLHVNPVRRKTLPIVVTVLLFAVEHNPSLAGAAASAAPILLYMGSGSLWSAIVANGVTNGILGAWIIFTGRWSSWHCLASPRDFADRRWL
jgi:CAAX prenyl protease-like protein